MSCSVTKLKLEDFPLKLKNPVKIDNTFYCDTCNVSVEFIIYNEKKKTVVKKGSSRPSVINKSKLSTHAEENGIRYCINNRLSSKYNIYIWRWSKQGNIKSYYCCKDCTNLAKKLNFENRIFTFDKNGIQSAIIENPSNTIGNQIRNLKRKE